MKKLRSMYRFCDKLLKIYEVVTKKGEEYYYGMYYEFVYNKDKHEYELSLVSKAKFFDKDMSDFRVREHFGMINSRSVSSDKFIDVNHRVIWTNNDYDEWEYYAEKYDDYEKDKINYDTYSEECSLNIDDERANLNVKVDGCIVAFANLGLWDGRHNGGKVIGNNVRKILYSDCDYIDWYCDRYNVRCTATHHDGTNHIVYRVAKSLEDAEKIVDEVAYKGMTEEEFMKKTKSLRPYVAKVYGF